MNRTIDTSTRRRQARIVWKTKMKSKNPQLGSRRVMPWCWRWRIITLGERMKHKLAKRASSSEVPSDILERANNIGEDNTHRKLRAILQKPRSIHHVCFANGSAGLEVEAIATALLGDGPLTKSLPNYSCHNDAINLFTNCTDTNAFRRIIDGNAERSQPTVMTNVLTNAHTLDNLITT